MGRSQAPSRKTHAVSCARDGARCARCFVAPLVLAYRQAGSRVPGTLSPVGQISPRVIQNASIVSRLGWVALAPLLAWGIGGELWPVIVYLVSAGLGLWLFYALRRPILDGSASFTIAPSRCTNLSPDATAMTRGSERSPRR